MQWYLWAVILYIISDRIVTVWMIGKEIEITAFSAILSLFTGAFIIWSVYHA